MTSPLPAPTPSFSSIAGLRVLVTGGTRGIGLGIAEGFAIAGAHVVLSGRDAAVGAAAAETVAGAATAALGSPAGPVAFVAGDVAVPDDCERVVAEAVATLGGLDVLCANAGMFPSAPLDVMTADDVDAMFAVNVRGSILAVRHAIPALTASGRGRVILTSSITGPITGYPGWSHYGASKAAQLGFMRTAAIELASRGITVNAVLPGNILTEGVAGMGEDYLDGMAASIPQRRLGSPADIAAACRFFALEEAAYVTGQALAIDGGQVLPESPEAVG